MERFIKTLSLITASLTAAPGTPELLTSLMAEERLAPFFPRGADINLDESIIYVSGAYPWKTNELRPSQMVKLPGKIF